jgi:hypothetical protein
MLHMFAMIFSSVFHVFQTYILSVLVVLKYVTIVLFECCKSRSGIVYAAVGPTCHSCLLQPLGCSICVTAMHLWHASTGGAHGFPCVCETEQPWAGLAYSWETRGAGAGPCARGKQGVCGDVGKISHPSRRGRMA